MPVAFSAQAIDWSGQFYPGLDELSRESRRPVRIRMDAGGPPVADYR
jgi:hypothetical protein